MAFAVGNRHGFWRVAFVFRPFHEALLFPHLFQPSGPSPFPLFLSFYSLFREFDDQSRWKRFGSESAGLFLISDRLCNGRQRCIKEISLSPSNGSGGKTSFDEFNVLRPESRFDLAFGETVPSARIAHGNILQCVSCPYLCEEALSNTEGNAHIRRYIRYVIEFPEEGDLLSYISKLKEGSAKVLEQKSLGEVRFFTSLSLSFLCFL